MLETAEQHNAKLTGKVVIPEPPVIIEVPAPEQPKPKGRNVVTMKVKQVIPRRI